MMDNIGFYFTLGVWSIVSLSSNPDLTNGPQFPYLILALSCYLFGYTTNQHRLNNYPRKVQAIPKMVIIR